MTPALYFFHSSRASQSVRLALGYKAVAFDERPLDYLEDETFFELGVARQVPLLRLSEGHLLHDASDILWRIDALFPATPPLVEGCIDDAAWQALLEWRGRVAPIIERLCAPVMPAYSDIGGDEAAMASYKAEVKNRFGLTLEDLANDRYAGYAQLDRHTDLKALARHLGEKGFYTGQMSVADVVLTADLYPLQLLDGIALPIDLMYYFSRVIEACGKRLDDALAIDM